MSRSSVNGKTHCGDFGGVTAQGAPCGFPKSGLCQHHGNGKSTSGRPPKMTAQVRKQILDTLRKGNTKTVAYSLAGISSTTFNRWQAENEEFRDALTCAESVALSKYAEDIAAAGEKDWRALAWLLERLDPENWSLKHKIEHSGGVAVTLEDALRALRSDR